MIYTFSTWKDEEIPPGQSTAGVFEGTLTGWLSAHQFGATGQNQICDEGATKKNILQGGPPTRYNLGYNSYN